MRTILLLSLSGLALMAQVGYPPGQYPPGTRGPGSNGPGLPIPGRNKKGSSGQQQSPPPKTYSGVIRALSEKSIDLEATDTRLLTIEITDKTTKPTNLKVGDGVDVDATQDNGGQYHAVSIKANAKVASQIEPSNPVALAQQIQGPEEKEQPEGRDLPTTIVRPQGPLYEEGDNGPPKLKRGIPPKRPQTQQYPDEGPAPKVQEANTTIASVTAPSAPAPAAPEVQAQRNPRHEFIEKARATAANFTEGLPNYFCQEMATRYVSESKPAKWDVVDVISVALVWDHGKEIYKDFTVNGKASKKSPEESGAWSTGEFGSTLAALFSPGTQADFKYVRDATINHIATSVYDFKVERVRSSWKVTVPGQSIVPAYRGTVWIDKQSAHVLRIETQAQDIPDEFPRATVESAIDYDYISLGTPEKFLLPVHAEMLSCARGSTECERNAIDFRNYHKYTGESTIKFNQ